MTRISPDQLRALRNKIPIADLIRLHLDLPNKYRDSFLRFLCPLCNEFDTAVNPKTNLARCFRCAKNFNTIDLVIAVRRCPFRDAVDFLQHPTPPGQQIAALLGRR